MSFCEEMKQAWKKGRSQGCQCPLCRRKRRKQAEAMGQSHTVNRNSDAPTSAGAACPTGKWSGSTERKQHPLVTFAVLVLVLPIMCLGGWWILIGLWMMVGWMFVG